ncbi:MAG: hypothetical protein WD231_00070 [Candidatus Woykebacteria bacterium]
MTPRFFKYLSETTIKTDFLAFFLLSVLGIFLLTLIDKGFSGILISRYGVVLILSLVLWFLFIFYISMFKSLSKIIILIITMWLIYPIIYIFIAFSTCEGLGCLAVVFGILYLEGFLIFVCGSIPILYSRLSVKGQDLLISSKFWVSGLSTLAAVSVLWFVLIRIVNNIPDP